MSLNHRDLQWNKVQEKLDTKPNKLWSLHEMERTGGEPDVIGYDSKTGEYTFGDCSNETSEGRRSVCYDHEALALRKANKPYSCAMQMAANMGLNF